MSKNPFKIYEDIRKENLSPREMEASVLARAGHMLKQCQATWDTEGHDKRLDEALAFNQKVWTFFQGELTQPDNPLPLELRSNILNLSVFIDKTIFDIMAYPEPEKLTPVIEIDMNLAAGLLAKPVEVTLEEAV